MSELMNTMAGGSFRHTLLVTVSTLTLVAPLAVREASASDDANKPTLWIELGGQLERLTTETPFSPPFISKQPRPGFQDPTPLEAERAPRYSYGAEGKISFQPQESDWLFSAAIRYGRSSNNKRVHQSGEFIHFTIGGYDYNISPVQFADTRATHEESHAVIDFQAGKDVGLGLFGRNSQSVLSAGVRFAQFSSKSAVSISSDPDLILHSITPRPGLTVPLKYHHTYFGAANTDRSFHGIGPSLSWSATVPIVDSGQNSEIMLDVGLNGAVLFGRQKTFVHHETRGEYYNQKYALFGGGEPHTVVYSHTPPDRSRSRSVTVPNIGGFAGVSFRYSGAKVSFGYRGEIFFNAMDDGFDTARSADRSFHGPFATISIGLP
jgi:hypothetical protein